MPRPRFHAESFSALYTQKGGSGSVQGVSEISRSTTTQLSEIEREVRGS